MKHKVPVAMVFAAGVGSRLKPYTLTMPKALVKVDGITMLERVLVRLRNAGVQRVVINIHHFADMVRKYVTANNNFELNIAFSDESDKLLDTGGGLLKARDLLLAGGADTIIVHNADIVTDAPLDDMLDVHHQTQAMATLLCRQRKSSRQLYFDRQTLRLCGWADLRETNCVLPADFNVNRPDIIPLAFGGVHILSASIFEPLLQYAAKNAPDGVFSITPFYATEASKYDFRAFCPSRPYMWADIGSPKKLEQAEAELQKYNTND